MIASVGSSTFGPGSVSTRTSRLPFQVTAFIEMPLSEKRTPIEYPGGIGRNGSRPTSGVESASEEPQPANSDKHHRSGRADRPHQHCGADVNDAPVAVWTEDEVEHRR